MATVEEDLVAEAERAVDEFTQVIEGFERKAAEQALSSDEERELTEARLDQKAAQVRLTRIRDAVADGNMRQALHIARCRCSG